MDWLFLALAVALVAWSLVSAVGGERARRRAEMMRRVRLDHLKRQLADARTATAG